MGFFKKIGKQIGKTVKSVAKTVSIKNVMNAATGNYAAIAKEAGSRALGSLKKSASGGVVSVATNSGKVVQMTEKNAVAAIQNGTVPSTAKMAAGDGNGIMDWIKTAAGGAAAAVGVQLAGTDEANAAINATGSSYVTAWFKKNVLYVVGGVVVLIGGIIYWRSRRGKKGRGF